MPGGIGQPQSATPKTVTVASAGGQQCHPYPQRPETTKTWGLVPSWENFALSSALCYSFLSKQNQSSGKVTEHGQIKNAAWEVDIIKREKRFLLSLNSPPSETQIQNAYKP